MKVALRLHVPLLVLGCAVPTLAQTRVLVVDDDPRPGVLYHQVADAIAAARDGDALLVEAGSYGPAVIDGKALSIQADGAASIDSLLVRNLGPAQVVSVRGFSIPNAGGASAAVRIEEAQGTVWLEDCAVTSPAAACGASHAGIHARASASVVLIRTSAAGAAVPSVNVQGVPCAVPAPGLVVEGSVVHAFECAIEGGAGGDPSPTGAFGGPGGPGSSLDGGFLFLSASSVRGGAGGPVDVGTCVGGEGGPGVDLRLDQPLVHALETTVEGGQGGANCSGCLCQVGGAPGPATRVATGSVRTMGRPALRMQATAAPREHSFVQLDLTGPPGLPVFLSIDGDPAPLWLPKAQGTLLLPVPTVVFFLGFLSPSGTLTHTLPTARNGVGEAATYYAQPAYVENDRGAVLGTGTFLLLLDEDY